MFIQPQKISMGMAHIKHSRSENPTNVFTFKLRRLNRKNEKLTSSSAFPVTNGARQSVKGESSERVRVCVRYRQIER